MNPEFPHLTREELEVRLTALLLGELPPAEAEAVRQLVASDAALGQMLARLEQAIRLVREGLAEPGEAAPAPQPTLKLAAEKREQLLAQFKQPPNGPAASPKEVKPATVTPEQMGVKRIQPKRGKYRWLINTSITVAVLLLLSALLLPTFQMAKQKRMYVTSLPGQADMAAPELPRGGRRAQFSDPIAAGPPPPPPPDAASAPEPERLRTKIALPENTLGESLAVADGAAVNFAWGGTPLGGGNVGGADGSALGWESRNKLQAGAAGADMDGVADLFAIDAGRKQAVPTTPLSPRVVGRYNADLSKQVDAKPSAPATGLGTVLFDSDGDHEAGLPKVPSRGISDAKGVKKPEPKAASAPEAGLAFGLPVAGDQVEFATPARANTWQFGGGAGVTAGKPVQSADKSPVPASLSSRGRGGIAAPEDPATRLPNPGDHFYTDTEARGNVALRLASQSESQGVTIAGVLANRIGDPTPAADFTVESFARQPARPAVTSTPEPASGAVTRRLSRADSLADDGVPGPSVTEGRLAGGAGGSGAGPGGDRAKEMAKMAGELDQLDSVVKSFTGTTPAGPAVPATVPAKPGLPMPTLKGTPEDLPVAASIESIAKTEAEQRARWDVLRFAAAQPAATPATPPMQPETEARYRRRYGIEAAASTPAPAPAPVATEDAQKSVSTLGDTPLLGALFQSGPKDSLSALGEQRPREQATASSEGAPHIYGYRVATNAVVANGTVDFGSGQFKANANSAWFDQGGLQPNEERFGNRADVAIVLPGQNGRLTEGEAGSFVQGGLQSYESGINADAAGKFAKAKVANPQSQTANYYANDSHAAQTAAADRSGRTTAQAQVTDDWLERDLNAPVAAGRQLSSRPAAEEREKQLALNREAKEPSPAATFAAKKRELEEAIRFKNILSLKTLTEKTDMNLPKTAVVEVVDAATPALKPSTTLLGRAAQLVTGAPDQYQSTARIRTERDTSDIDAIGGKAHTAGDYNPYFIQSEQEVLQSRVVLGKVAEALKRDEKWARKYGDLKPEQAVEVLKEKLEVKPERNTSLLGISAKSDDPAEAAQIANQVALEYQKYRSDQRTQMSLRGLKTLEDQSSEQDQKIAGLQKELEQARQSLGIMEEDSSSLGTSRLLHVQEVQRLEARQIEAEGEVARKEKLLNELKAKSLAELRQVLPTALVQPDPLFNELLGQLSFAEQQLAKLNKDYGPAHSEPQRVEAQVAELNKKINERAKDILAGLTDSAAATEQQAEDLKRQVAKARGRNTEPPPPPKPPANAPIPQPEVASAENAFSTFSLNVADVSFKLAQASLEKGVLPDVASLRSEEFLNAFDYRDAEPAPGAPVAFAWERARDPFAHNRDFLRFSLKTAASGRQAGRAMNLVLVLDNSGSMERADRVQIIQQAMRVLASQLGPQDRVSVVTFARTPRLWLDAVTGNKAGEALQQIATLTPQGGTDLGAALKLAYETAVRHYQPGGLNRVVLLTDGAANLGDVDPDSLKRQVEANRKQGIALDSFGIGWEGYNDDLLEVLTRNGDGRYGFVNTPEAAATEFAGQLAGALQVAASDVKVQVEFNPARVTNWRQVGYAKHQLKKEQFRDNAVDAAEIAAQEAGNGLYVVETNPNGQGDLATVRVRYKVPGTSDYRELEWAVPYTGTALPLPQASPAMRLAASATEFSEWLAGSPFAAEVTPDKLLNLLSGVPATYGADERPKKLEWMIRQAKSLSGK
jgi:uncharacterized protein involved in exopolysaccharide biosynthesis/uncharacterized protein YegL